MTYIEFLGAPGVGKSAIHSQLLKSSQLFGGVEDDAVKRFFLNRAGPKYKVPYQLTPSVITRFFDKEFIQYRLGHAALEDFIREYPNFIQILLVAMEAASYESEKIFSLCRRSAEQYQMSASTVKNGEILCLDESFAQRAFTILWRCSDTSFPLEDYFTVVPVPDLVVHVDAPSDVCLDRQRKRGRVAVETDWETNEPKQVQDESRKICERIRNHLKRETSILYIENTGSINSSVNRIIQEIEEVYSQNGNI